MIKGYLCYLENTLAFVLQWNKFLVIRLDFNLLDKTIHNYAWRHNAEHYLEVAIINFM